MLEEHSEFDGVISDDLSRIVRPCVNEPGPGAGIGAVIDRSQSVDRDRRDFLAEPLGARVNERVIYPVGAAVAARSACRICIDGAEAVRAGGHRELVNQRRRKGARQTQGRRAVGP